MKPKKRRLQRFSLLVVFVCPRDSLNFSDVDVLSTLGVWWMGSHKAPGAEIERRKMTEFVFSEPGKESDT